MDLLPCVKLKTKQEEGEQQSLLKANFMRTILSKYYGPYLMNKWTKVGVICFFCLLTIGCGLLVPNTETHTVIGAVLPDDSYAKQFYQEVTALCLSPDSLDTKIL